MSLILIGGGSRSGKSRYALNLARKSGGPVAFIATARAEDDEMRERIRRHRKERGPEFTTVRGAFRSSLAADRRGGRFDTFVVDCLTLWLSNHLLAGVDDMAQQCRRLIEAAAGADARVLMVTGEVGCGIVPENALARRFSRSGWPLQSGCRRGRRRGLLDGVRYSVEGEMRRLLAAMQFLTVVPATSPEPPAAGAIFFPLVGALIGAAAGAVYVGAIRLFPTSIAALFALLFLIMITGALHEDGLADVFDAFRAGRSPERIHIILKDSRIGTFGGLALAISVLLRWQSMGCSALARFPPWRRRSAHRVGLWSRSHISRNPRGRVSQSILPGAATLHRGCGRIARRCPSVSLRTQSGEAQPSPAMPSRSSPRAPTSIAGSAVSPATASERCARFRKYCCCSFSYALYLPDPS